MMASSPLSRLKAGMCGSVLLVAMSWGSCLAAQPRAVPPSQTMPQERFVETYGQKIAYYDVGDGPVLLLVHGSGVSAAIDWGQVIRPLSKHYRVIALDLIGHGNSAKPRIGYTTRTYVEFLGQFLRDLGITHLNIAGESMGGGIVTLYAIMAAQPGSDLPKVDKLVITDGAVPVPGKWPARPAAPSDSQTRTPVPPGGAVGTWQEYRDLLSGGMFRNKPGYITGDYAKDVWSRLAGYQNGIAQQMTQQGTPGADAVSKLFADHLQDIKAPTLIIWGGDDTLVPVSNVSYIKEKLSAAQVVIYDKVGHAPAIEEPERYVADLIKFLGK